MYKKIIILIVLLLISFVIYHYIQKGAFKLITSYTRIVTIIDLEGDVKVVTSGGSKTINAFKNMRLKQGDRLLTGVKAWVSLKIDTDNQVLVSESTNLSIDELSGSNNSIITRLALETGKIWSSIKEKLSDNSKYEIKTPTATMGVRGTKFYVDALENTTKLAVLDGSVAMLTNIMTIGPEGKIITEEVTLLVNKNKQISIEKDQVLTKDELSDKIKDVAITSFDERILKFIQMDSDEIDSETYNEINEYLGYKKMETTLIRENKVQVKGSVFLPDGKRNIEGGHIHIRNAKNEWIYYGLLNANGDFIAGDLSDGLYWLRSDPVQVNEYARSNEVPFEINNGKANHDVINLKLNNIQLSVTIVNPEGIPITEGYLYVSDSNGNWIYYSEIEKAINLINIGGLPEGSYTIIAYPALISEFVPSNAKRISITNGKADSSTITLKLNEPQFSGTVLLADGKTVAIGGHVHLRDKSNMWLQYVNTDMSGGFKIGGLQDGKYWLRADSAEAPGYISSDEFGLEVINGKAFPASPQLVLKK